MTRYQLAWMLLKLIFTALFRRDFSKAREPFEPKPEPVPTAEPTPQTVVPQMQYNPVTSRLERVK
jgi:hypothetical protein